MSDYPTAEQLARIRTWPADDLPGWFAYIKAAGHWWGDPDPWGWTDSIEPDGVDSYRVLYRISTGGWSGNEEIIAAMQDNRACWVQCWESTRRGGHYEFRVAR